MHIYSRAYYPICGLSTLPGAVAAPVYGLLWRCSSCPLAPQPDSGQEAQRTLENRSLVALINKEMARR